MIARLLPMAHQKARQKMAGFFVHAFLDQYQYTGAHRINAPRYSRQRH